MKMIEIRKPDDFHIHLRQGEMLNMTVSHCAAHFARAIIMPNTLPPVDSAETLREYRKEILDRSEGFEPLMTFKLLKKMTEKDILSLKEAGAIAGKFFPAGSTTNAEDGIRHWKEVAPLLEAMEQNGLVLSIHGEDPSVYSLDREKAFIPQILEICESYPKLKVVFEHLSSADGIRAVENGPENLAGTITVHHLLLTLDDVIGGALNPHAFCKPVLKSPDDRKEIQRVVLEGNSRFFFGSDSAPHPLESKLNGSAGSYTAPIALSLLAAFFEENNKMDKLEDFVSRFGAQFYDIPENSETISLVNESWTVPEAYGSVKPIFAGKKMTWKVKEN